MHGDPDTQGTGRNPSDGLDMLNLAQIINILWRRRLMIVLLTLVGLIAGIVYGIVTPPLYRATATVRPGITGYLANGNPVRDWELKDIVSWYKKGMFATGLRVQLDWPTQRPAPIIQADFIPRGVGIQGGNVVTLSLLHTDRDEAEQILDATILVFNDYAENNSIGNNVSLAHKSLQSQIDQISSGRDNVEIKRSLLDIEITRAKRELEEIAILDRKLDLDLAEHEIKQQQREAKAAQIDQDVEETRSGLSEMDDFLARMREKEARQVDRDSLLGNNPQVQPTPMLWWDMVQDKTAVTARLLMNYLEMQTQMWDEQQESLDLRYNSDSQALRIQGEMLQQRFDLVNRRELVNLTVAEMEINRDRTLTQELVDIDDKIRILQSRLDVLIPMERIGNITTTVRPIRPRKARATTLLTLVTLLGSIMLAFVWDYLSNNRQVIFDSRARRD